MLRAIVNITQYWNRKQLKNYAIVGIAGFLVDAGLLSLLVHVFDMGPIVSRMPSFVAAVTVTWALNRTHTFSDSIRYKKSQEYRRYFVVQIIGAVSNLLVYVFLISVFPWMGRVPVLPLAVGAIIGLVVNFHLSRVYVFPGRVSEHE